MVINTDNLVSITEANQNFSRVARMVDENGAAVILKNNVPRYVLMEFSQVEDEQQAKDEDILEISKRLIAKNIALVFCDLFLFVSQFIKCLGIHITPFVVGVRPTEMVCTIGSL